MPIQLFDFPKIEHSPVSAFLSLHLLCCDWYMFNKGNPQGIMALTHLLRIYLNGVLHIRSKRPYLFMHLVCSIHLSYAHYINSVYDLCLGVIQLSFSTEASAATLSLHQHLHSICENRQLSIALGETE